MNKKDAAEFRERYFGLVIDNFTCNDEIMSKSLTVLMGEYLFYHIVDTPQTALRIISELNAAELPGEVHFFALSIIDSLEFDKPDGILRLSFDIKFRKVFEKICTEMPLSLRDLENKLNEGLNPATLLPDVIEENGALIAMRINADINSMALYKQQLNLLDLEEATHYQLKENSWRMESTICSLNDTSEMLDKQRETINSIQHVQSSLAQTNNLIQLCESRIATKRTEVQKYETKLKELTDTKNRYENELKLKLLVEQETKAIERVQVAITNKKMELQQVNAEIKKLRTQRDNISEFLEHSLVSRYSALEEKSQIHVNNTNELSRKEQELTQATENLAKCEVNFNQTRCQMNDLRNEHEKLKVALKDMEQLKMDAQEKQKSLFADIEMMGIHQKNLTADFNRLLTIKPYDATEFHNPDIAEMTEADIANQLDIARHQLTTYQNTNSFDMNILDSFKKDRENFIRRRAELTKIGDKISTVMEKLEASIGTSIRSTFNDLATKFQSNFSKFVSNGSARLKLIETAETGSVSQVNCDESVNEITGIEIYAQYNDTEKPFDDLLGQERRVVSLVLIISMQQLCPAPFYLFDCIDEVIKIVAIILKFYDNSTCFSVFCSFSDHFRAVFFIIHQLFERFIE